MAPTDGWHVDVTALRADEIEDDLRARDFTVNAVAVPLAGGDPIDPTGGLADVDARLLRAASDASFEDDPLRLLRAARLAAGLELELDAKTSQLARDERRDTPPIPPASGSSPSCAASSPGPIRCGRFG